MDHSSPSIRRGDARDERGVSIIQFVLVFPLLLLIISGILDISTMLTIESLLDEAARRSVSRAITINNLDIDPRGADPSSYEFQRFLLAREKSNADGVEFLRGVNVIDTEFTAPASHARVRLLPLRFTEDRPSGLPTVITDGIMVLIPGECLTVLETGQVICNRETLGTDVGSPAPVQPPRFLLERHPLMAVAAARFDGYLPFFHGKVLLAQSYAFRDSIPQGPFPAWEDPQLLAEGPPIPAAEKEVETLGAPQMPEEEPWSCTVNWALCAERSQYFKRPLQPHNVDNDGDGFCDCEIINN